MAQNFSIRAGAQALKHIQDKGLSPQDITTIPAAAGGPKWIVLYALDKYLHSEWFADRDTPLNLIGASAGAWRMLCYALDKPEEALSAFLKTYIEQRYDHMPAPAVVSQNVIDILKEILAASGQQGLWKAASKRLYVISSESSFTPRPQSSYKRQFGKIVVKNALSRSFLKNELNRIVFTNSDHRPLVEDGITTKYIRFNSENLVPALQSTGTLPLYMAPVSDVPEVSGLLWDGALIDYHICHQYHDEGLVFYPHFTDKLIAGWFDKFVPWRMEGKAFKERMVVLSPSKSFVHSLPDHKIPDRKDFNRYFDDNDRRIQNWYEVAKRGEDIAEEFDTLYKSGALIDHIKLF